MNDTLYDQFETLDPERMDALGRPEERRAGHRLYEAERFGGLTWLVPERHLRAVCDKRQVEFAAKDGEMIGACACGATLHSGACRHLYALLFAVCNLLDDERYRVFFRNNKFRDHLKQVYWSALGETRNPQPRGTHPELRLYFDENHHFSLRVSSSWHQKARERGLDQRDPLYRLVNLSSRGADGQLALIRYLDASTGRIPLSVHLPDRSYARLRWSGGESMRVLTALSITEEGPLAASHEVAGGQPGIQGLSLIPLPPHLVLDPHGWTLRRMDGFLNVDEFFHARTTPTGRRTRDRIPQETFHAGPAHVVGADRDQALAGLILRGVDGRVGSASVPARVRVDLTLGEDTDAVVYCPRVVLDGENLPLAAGLVVRQALRPFLDPLPSLRSADCRRALWRLVDAFFLEDDPAPALAIQEVILEEGAIPPDQREKVREQLKDVEAAVFHRRCYLLRVRDGQWIDAEVPHRAVGFSLAAGRRILHALSTERDGEHVLRATAALLKERLGTLIEALNEKDIEVRLDDQPVRPAELDVVLTSRPTEAMDWFELHPSVRLEGVEMAPGEWGRMLRGGALETARGLAVLTRRDRDILDRLNTLVRAAPDGGEGAASGRIRRLEILSWLELESKGVRLEVEPELREVLDRLRTFERMDEVPLPSRLQADLRDYQRTGVQWLAFLYRHRFGACLADDMGLGKTIQTIALLGGIHAGDVPAQTAALRNRPHLIVVPASLVFNWEEEFSRFYPDLRVVTYTGADRAAEFDAANVVITTYGILARDLDRLRDLAFHVLVFDEAQALKNVRAARSEAARAIQAAFVVCLTGTPLENHVGEYFAILDLALPGLLGPVSHLMRSGSDRQRDAAIRRARPFVLRRTKKAILSELPPKVEQSIHLDLSEGQREAYTRTVEKVRETVHEAFTVQTGNQAGVIALTALARLRQICISPALIGWENAEGSPKIEFLVEQLQSLREEGHAALVFSQFTRCLDLVEQALEQVGIDRLRLDGRTAAAKRKEMVNRFQTGGGPAVFLLSLRSGGTGLNLTRASYVFHLDPWWNPAVETQATDRAHRIGQSNTVFTTRLIMRHTVEEKMELLKRRKQAVVQAVLAGGEGEPSRAGTLTRQDIDFLLS